jgi:hypothetical protein
MRKRFTWPFAARCPVWRRCWRDGACFSVQCSPFYAAGDAMQSVETGGATHFSVTGESSNFLRKFPEIAALFALGKLTRKFGFALHSGSLRKTVG